jgi:hypothetical protein
MGYPKAIAHYLSDCTLSKDTNAVTRVHQEIFERFWDQGIEVELAGVVGVSDSLEAGLCLADVLGRAQHPTVIMANAAPRRDNDRAAEGYENGSPFGYVRLGEHLVVATIDGYMFSVLQKIVGRRLTVNTLNTREVIGVITDNSDEQERVAYSQFRSLDFLIWVTAKLVAGTKLPFQPHCAVVDIGSRVLYIDYPFGNIKTSLFLEDIKMEVDLDREFGVCLGERKERARFYPGGLTSMSQDGRAGVVIGSSGCQKLGGHNFLELQIKGGNAAQALQAKPGMEISFSQ